MSVSFTVSNKTLFITLRGRIDSSIRDKFREMNRLLGNGIQHIEIDMAQADFIDSAALGILLVMQDKLLGENSTFKIKNAKNSVKETLLIVKFDEIFEIC